MSLRHSLALGAAFGLLLAIGGSAGGAIREDTLAISPPADMTVAATTVCGQLDCAVVTYSFTVTGGTPPYNLVCNFASGALIPVGSHTISCLAQDSRGNSTPNASFNVTITPGGPTPPPPTTESPLQIASPPAMTVSATTPCGQTECAVVTYSFTVTGGTPPYNLVCNLPSGGLFTVGSHIISCLAQDSRGNSTPQATFNLTVTPSGSTPPPPATESPLQIASPPAMTAPATTPCGQTECARVSYSYTVTGGTPPYNLVCNLPSGGLFTVGSHIISCLAQDSRGNSTPQATFNLTVTESAAAGSTGGSSGGSTGTPSSGGGGNGSSVGSGGTDTGGSTSSSSGPTAPGSTAGAQPSSFTATVPSAAISASPTAGKDKLAFVLKLTKAAVVSATLTASTGKLLFHFRSREAAGRTMVSRSFSLKSVKRGTKLTLRVLVSSSGTSRTITEHLRA